MQNLAAGVELLFGVLLRFAAGGFAGQRFLTVL